MKIGVIGIGSGGNQIAKEAALKGFEVLAFNTSEVDLDAVATVISPEKLVIIGDTKGCAKNRKISKNVFIPQLDKIVDRVRKTFITDIAEKGEEPFDAICVAFTTAGGTGSGSGVMVTDVLNNELSEEGKLVFFNAATLPSDEEGIQAQANAIEAVSELHELGLAYMLYDNSSVNDTNVYNIFKAINTSIVDDLIILQGELSLPSDAGIFDYAERRDILTTPGLFTINKVRDIKENFLDNMTLGQLMVQSIKESYNVDIERDKIVRKMVFLVSLQEDVLTKLDREYTDVVNHVGRPIKTFEQISKSNKNTGYIVTILSGMSYPRTVIEGRSEIINDYKSAIMKQSDVNTKEIKDSVSWLSEMDKKPTKSEDRGSLLKKYQ